MKLSAPAVRAKTGSVRLSRQLSLPIQHCQVARGREFGALGLRDNIVTVMILPSFATPRFHRWER